MSAPPVQVAGVGLAAPASTDDAVANRISESITSDVVPAGSERESKLAANIPVGRIGRPDDVTRAVMFFADPANSFVTGQTLYVCGGASVGTLTI